MRRLERLGPTPVLDTYWRFAVRRQNIFRRKFRNEPPPWTRDPILLRHKFTNAYRASDRVSQYLIQKVIYGGGEQKAEEMFFRTILFKLFNRIGTWELLEREFGEIGYSDFSIERYDSVLSAALERGERIYSAAYIMPPSRNAQAARKHSGHLLLLQQMMKDALPSRLAQARSLENAFEILRAYPGIGDFLAYQYVIDLNYGPLLDFSEMDFVVPGPGARRGIRKCFQNLGGATDAEVIRLVTESQEQEFNSRGLTFRGLWGRSLQLVDCQNLFCEVDKYSRVAHPEVADSRGPTRIKQIYRPTETLLRYWYPPKWDLNKHIAEEQSTNPCGYSKT